MVLDAGNTEMKLPLPTLQELSSFFIERGVRVDKTIIVLGCRK
jgi:hypothetical protein